MDSSKKILGIDYGTKRVGLALSDETRKFALPLQVVENNISLMENLLRVIRDNSVGEVVIGESHDYKGKPNKIMDNINRLKDQLEQELQIVYLEPEFMTSVQAERLQGKNDMSDASAAALILQSYLHKNNS